MRSVTFRYPNAAALERDLSRDRPELPLPSGQRGQDGEWVLAVFRADDGTATASAARLSTREGGMALVFEPRDWDKLVSELAVTTPPPPKSRAASSSARRPPKPDAGTPRKGAKGPGSSNKPPAPSSSRSSRGRKSTRSMPPPSQSGTVLTRTLVPPRAAEIHEADAPDHTLEASVAIVGPSPHAPRLLLVDDDLAIQELMREMLDAIGLALECASDGEEALDRLVLQPFDLVVLDWNLPGMSGLELCRELRRHAHLSTIPILFLTAQSTSRDLVDAFAAGADDFVAKPFRAPELGARIFALLRRAKIGLSLPPPPG